MSESAAPPSRWRGIIPVALLALHVVLLASSVSRKSVTADEFVDVPAGLCYWQTGDFSVDGLNPPLAKLWTSLGAMTMSPKMPIAAETADRDKDYPWTFGRLFELKNWDRYDAIFLRARVMVMALSVLCGLVLFLWARRRLGFWPAVLALALYAVEPNILAHGRLATLDMTMTVCVLLTLVALDAFLERGGWWRVVAVGVALGATCLVKFSGLVIALALPGVFVACVAFVKGFAPPLRAPFAAVFREGRLRVAWRSLVALVAVALVALLVINAAYGFSGTLRRLNPLTVRSHGMQTVADSWLGAVPVPLPALYVQGLDGQQLSVEQGETVNYLNKRWSLKGEWYYYLEAFALKVPIAVLLLAAIGIVSTFIVRPRQWTTVIVGVVVGGLFWAAHSLGSNKQIGLRYMLPMFPLVLLLCSRAALVVRRLAGRARITAVAVLVLASSWAAVDAFVAHPDYLAYFNPIAGGSRGGPRYLLDSNIDWGQDLPGLADWLKRENVTGTVYVAYFGDVAPELYGIKAKPPFRGVKGVVAVSVNYVYGMPYGGHKPDEFAWVRARKPDAVIGGSIYVYRTDRP